MRLSDCAGLVLVAISQSCIASAPWADEVKSIVVRYANRASIELVCDQDQRCSIVVVKDGVRHIFKDTHLEVALLPRAPVLFTENTLPGRYSFHVQIECPKSAATGAKLNLQCKAAFAVQDGRIDSRHLIKVEFGNEMGIGSRP